MKAGDRIVFTRDAATSSGRVKAGREGRVVDPGIGSAVIAITLPSGVEVEVIAQTEAFRVTEPKPSRLNADVLAAMAAADLTVVAETDAYVIYSDGTLEPGPFGTRYSLMAMTFDGERIRLAEADFVRNSVGTLVNLGATSSTDDPLVLRAKADILSRMADILTKEMAK